MKKQKRSMALVCALVLAVSVLLLSACGAKEERFTILGGGVKADSIRYAPGTENYQVAVIERDGKFGLIDFEGNIVQPIEYESIGLQETEYNKGDAMLCAYSPAATVFAADGSIAEVELSAWGYDAEAKPYWYNGEFTSYSEATELGYEESWHRKTNRLGTLVFERQRVIAVQEIREFITNEYGVKDVELVSPNYALLDYETKTLLTDFIYEDCSYVGFVDGVLPVKKDGKWGYVNEKGETLTEFIYDASEIVDSGATPLVRLYASTNGYTVVRKGDAWGLIDNRGNTVVEPIYQGISQVDDKGRFWIEKNGKWWVAELTK